MCIRDRWLWGAIAAIGNPIRKQLILGVSVFTIVTRAITSSRIPIPDDTEHRNTIWFRSKAAIAKALLKLFPELRTAVSELEAAMGKHPLTAEIWRQAEEVKPENWDFPLLLRSVETPDLFLEFIVHVDPVKRDKEDIGFVVTYEPQGETTTIVARVYDNLVQKYGNIQGFPYILRHHLMETGGGDVSLKEKTEPPHERGAQLPNTNIPINKTAIDSPLPVGEGPWKIGPIEPLTGERKALWKDIAAEVQRTGAAFRAPRLLPLRPPKAKGRGM